MKSTRFALSTALLLAGAAPGAAQVPMAPPLPEPVPAPQDVPFPGTIVVAVDATDTTRGLYRVTETIPLPPGTRSLTLQLPRWLPGNHAPTGPLALLAGLDFRADGKQVAWRRDGVEVNAFHLDLPVGARTLVAKFDHTSPLQTPEGRISMTDSIVNLQWEKMSLYPAGHYARRIMVQPSATFPAGWQAWSALDGKAAGQPRNRVSWSATDYATLVDSPVMAGANARRFDLGRGVALSLVADKAENLAVAPAGLAALSALADEGVALFGARPFDHYDLLVAASDTLGGIGLEHHRSTEIRLEPRALVDWANFDWARGVLAHEFVHAWNGKFRRPAGLWTPDYRQPMQGELLWVYEGQTQFWGLVLAARSGVQSREVVLGALAADAAQYAEGQPGRAWRSVEDTTHDPAISYRPPLPFPSWSRASDYYREAQLVWLEADQLIRAKTGGRRSLDDFARAFFAARDGMVTESTYTRADVVAALGAVLPYDWDAFLAQRIETPGQPAPLAGITMGGYRLVWREVPNAFERGRMAGSRTLALTYSLGVTLDREGRVTACLWDSPAFAAGLVPGARIVAVEGRAYDPEGLRAAIAAAKGTRMPIALLVQRGDRYFTVPIDYHGGLRYPWLERAAPGTEPTGLDRLLAPRRTGKAGG